TDKNAPPRVDERDVVRFHDVLDLGNQIAFPLLALAVTGIVPIPIFELDAIHFAPRQHFSDEPVVAQPKERHADLATRSDQLQRVVERTALLPSAFPYTLVP